MGTPSEPPYQFRRISDPVQAFEHLLFVGRVRQMAAENDATTGDDLGEVGVENDVRPVDEVRR